MRERKRRLWHETRWDGLPGFGNALRRLLYQFEGAAQLGDPNEPPYVPPANPKCPVCNELMADHRVDRGGPGERTHLRCPKPGAAAASAGDGADSA
ncbi:hypothetical protein ACXR2T_02480 [Leucobacter sp. HY1910]